MSQVTISLYVTYHYDVYVYIIAESASSQLATDLHSWEPGWSAGVQAVTQWQRSRGDDPRGVFTVVSHGGNGACAWRFIRRTTTSAAARWDAEGRVWGIQQKPLGPFWPLVWRTATWSRGTCPCSWARVRAVSPVATGQPALRHGSTTWTWWRCWSRSMASREGRARENHSGSTARMGWSKHWVQGLQDQSKDLARTPPHARGPLLLKNLTKGPWRNWSTWPMMSHGWLTQRMAPNWSTSWALESSMARRSGSLCLQHVPVSHITWDVRRAKPPEPSWRDGTPLKERSASTMSSSLRNTWASWWWMPSNWIQRRPSSFWPSRKVHCRWLMSRIGWGSMRPTSTWAILPTTAKRRLWTFSSTPMRPRRSNWWTFLKSTNLTTGGRTFSWQPWQTLKSTMTTLTRWSPSQSPRPRRSWWPWSRTWKTKVGTMQVLWRRRRTGVWPVAMVRGEMESWSPALTKCQFLSSKREPSVTPAVLLDIRLVNARPSPPRALIRMARTSTSRPKPRRWTSFHRRCQVLLKANFFI